MARRSEKVRVLGAQPLADRGSLGRGPRRYHGGPGGRSGVDLRMGSSRDRVGVGGRRAGRRGTRQRRRRWFAPAGAGDGNRTRTAGRLWKPELAPAPHQRFPRPGGHFQHLESGRRHWWLFPDTTGRPGPSPPSPRRSESGSGRCGWVRRSASRLREPGALHRIRPGGDKRGRVIHRPARAGPPGPQPGFDRTPATWRGRPTRSCGPFLRTGTGAWLCLHW